MKSDGRKNGLGTQGYPLRKIVERVNGTHLLSCGHRLPRPGEASDYDLLKSRRCVECGSVKNPPLEVKPGFDQEVRIYIDRRAHDVSYEEGTDDTATVVVRPRLIHSDDYQDVSTGQV